MRRIIFLSVLIFLATSCGTGMGEVKIKLLPAEGENRFVMMDAGENGTHCSDPVETSDRIVLMLESNSFHRTYTIHPTHSIRITHLEEGNYRVVVKLYREQFIIAWGKSDFDVEEGKIKRIRIALVCQEEWQ